MTSQDFDPDNVSANNIRLRARKRLEKKEEIKKLNRRPVIKKFNTLLRTNSESTQKSQSKTKYLIL